MIRGMVNMYIYKITNKVNGKSYIGQTRKTVEERFNQHVRDAMNGHGFYIQNAIRKYGVENFSVEVLATAEDIDELNRLEEYYIRKFNTVDLGYNLSYGGYSNTMDCKKTKDHHDNIMRSDDVRSRISATLKKRIKESGRTQEYAENLRKGFQSYKNSEKFKQDCSKRHLTPEHFRALNDAKNKSVYCIDESGKVIAEFDRVKDGAYWWAEHGYKVKNPYSLSDMIKKSYVQNIFIRGLKWIYRV